MDDSMAQPSRAATFDVGGWKLVLGTVCALVLGLMFIVSGTWKLTEPFEAAARMAQAKVPASLSMLAAVGVGVLEAVAGVLIIVPRLRRHGAWLVGFLLVVFMIYIGWHYNTLRGDDCSCFPWLKRFVGPGFFIGDAAMLIGAVLAGWWAKPSEGLRGPAIILGAVAVFAGILYGVHATRLTGAPAPDTIVVDGKPESLRYGKVFLFFFDPQCLHCYESAKKMSGYHWKESVRLYAIPYSVPEFANGFIKDTGFSKLKVSNDLEKFKASFSIPQGPSAATIENGRQQARITNFEGDEPAPTLRKLGFID
jgi:uncharacterized membrane protein YphA (DoxX/SURF4 family)